MLPSTIKLTAIFILFAVGSFAQYSIKGKINNKISNETIVGATINIASTFITVQSKSDGSFFFENLKNGTYILHTSLDGFHSRTDTVVMGKNKNVKITIDLEETELLPDEQIVSPTRVNVNNAFPNSQLSKTQLEDQNLGQDFPYLINQLPSVVSSSEAGNGIGYTNFRMRGIDASKINVSINGIPVNNPEMQNINWISLPDITSSIEDVQIQRGIGTSTNGTSTIGGSINILTTKCIPKSYGEFYTSYGSFNTLKNTLKVGSGLINEKFTFDARLSSISSDGFIDRTTSDLKSYYVSGAYYEKKSILKFITFSGLSKSYQAQNGIPESLINNDSQAINNFSRRNNLSDNEISNLLSSNNRTYNQFTYENQFNKHKQDFYQFLLSHAFTRSWEMNLAIHLNKGKASSEEFKNNQLLSDYNFQDVVVGTDTITSTDLISKQSFKNNFYGFTFSATYKSNKKLTSLIGGALDKYEGENSGEILWRPYTSNSNLPNTYYLNNTIKTNFNIFSKTTYAFTDEFSCYTDLQIRLVNHSYPNADQKYYTQQSKLYSFVNPKFGLIYEMSTNSNFYLSYAKEQREPGRKDYMNKDSSNVARPEKANDIEMGVRQNTKNAFWNLNFYYMEYLNQLVSNGNQYQNNFHSTYVENSYRTGMEAVFEINILKNLKWTGNFTLSKNKLLLYKESLVNKDSLNHQIIIHHESDIAFSPNIIMGNNICYEPIKKLKINFISKYVGEQFLDNTSGNDKKLNAYFVNDLRINYSIKLNRFRELGCTLAVYNLFNAMYESSGYSYGYIESGKYIAENFYHTQAGINIMAGLSLKI